MLAGYPHCENKRPPPFLTHSKVKIKDVKMRKSLVSANDSMGPDGSTATANHTKFTTLSSQDHRGEGQASGKFLPAARGFHPILHPPFEHSSDEDMRLVLSEDSPSSDRKAAVPSIQQGSRLS
jgi:hypothetical protein